MKSSRWNTKAQQNARVYTEQTNAGESFKRNFVLYMVHVSLMARKNIHCATYIAKNVANAEENLIGVSISLTII